MNTHSLVLAEISSLWRVRKHTIMTTVLLNITVFYFEILMIVGKGAIEICAPHAVLLIGSFYAKNAKIKNISAIFKQNVTHP